MTIVFNDKYSLIFFRRIQICVPHIYAVYPAGVMDSSISCYSHTPVSETCSECGSDEQRKQLKKSTLHSLPTTSNLPPLPGPLQQLPSEYSSRLWGPHSGRWLKLAISNHPRDPTIALSKAFCITHNVKTC